VIGNGIRLYVTGRNTVFDPLVPMVPKKEHLLWR